MQKAIITLRQRIPIAAEFLNFLDLCSFCSQRILVIKHSIHAFNPPAQPGPGQPASRPRGQHASIWPATPAASQPTANSGPGG
jgi:hypothetical protein